MNKTRLIWHGEKVKGEITQKIVRAIERACFAIEGDAKRDCPVDTGRLRSSITHEVTSNPIFVVGKIGTNVEYACVIGSRQQVYNPTNKMSANIGNYPYDHVLSMDGKAHKIAKRHKFFKHPVNVVSIRTREKYHPLVVTSNHLIPIIRDKQLFWEKAHDICESDMVFGKRALNAITDNSNKAQFTCVCGKKFWVEKFELRHRTPKYCSRECRHIYGPHDQNTGMRWSLNEEICEAKRGQNNPQWKHGNCKRQYPREFNRELKEIVKYRDNYQCQMCGASFDLVVHHQDEDKTNNDIDNLVTLCRPCHGSLNRLDCELPVVNSDIFTPKPILEIKHYTIKRNYKENIPRLYDFTIENENSFMVSGVLVHNSYIELGTYKMRAKPFLVPSWERHRDWKKYL